MYLDPGLGSMIIQIIVASLATVGAALIVMRNRLSGLFKKKAKASDETEDKSADAVLEDDTAPEHKESAK